MPINKAQDISKVHALKVGYVSTAIPTAVSVASIGPSKLGRPEWLGVSLGYRPNGSHGGQWTGHCWYVKLHATFQIVSSQNLEEIFPRRESVASLFLGRGHLLEVEVLQVDVHLGTHRVPQRVVYLTR